MKPLPKDLKSFSRKAVLKQILPLILAEIVALLLVELFGDDVFPPDRFGSSFPLLYRTIAILIPLFILVRPKKLFDRSFFGTVEKVQVKERFDHERRYKPTIEGLYRRIEVTLFIRTDKGKLIRRKVYSQKSKTDGDYDFFKEGDRVAHLYGSDKIVRLPEKEKTAVCLVCGKGSEKGENCSACGHTTLQV